MIEVGCLNLLTNKRFTLTFDSMYKVRRFVLKCMYSKKLKVVSKPTNWRE